MYTITVSSGQSIQQAINSIPSEDQPVAWTVRLEPGIYNEDVVIDRRVIIVGDGYNTSIRSIRTNSNYLVIISNVSVINTDTVLTIGNNNNVTLTQVWFVSKVTNPDLPVVLLGEQSVVNFDNCSLSLISTDINNNNIVDIQYNCHVQFTSCNFDINLHNSNNTTFIRSSNGSVNLGIFNSYLKLTSGNNPYIFNLHGTIMFMVNTVIDYGVDVGYVQSVFDTSNSVLYILTSAILYNSKDVVDTLLRDYNIDNNNPTWLYIFNSVVNGVYRVVVRYNDYTEEEVDMAEDPYVLYNFIHDGYTVTNDILNLGSHRTYIKHIKHGDYVTTQYDHTLLVSEPNITIDLMVGLYGQELVIKNISTGNIVIKGDIYGLNSPLTLSSAGVLRLQSDGYYWYKL